MTERPTLPVGLYIGTRLKPLKHISSTINTHSNHYFNLRSFKLYLPLGFNGCSLLKLAGTSCHRLDHGKYRGWNDSTVKISCWTNLAWLSAGINNGPKNMCTHVIFIVFFEFYLEIGGGDGVNQVFLKIR